MIDRRHNHGLAQLLTTSGLLAKAVIDGRAHDELTYRLADACLALARQQLGRADLRSDGLTAELTRQRQKI